MEDNNGVPEVESHGGSAETQNATPSKNTTENHAKEVSAATIGRMMGLATVSDLKLLDSKVDLLVTKVSGLTMKLDKVLTMLGSVATGSDLERVDVQVGSFKTMLRESMQSIEAALSKRD